MSGNNENGDIFEQYFAEVASREESTSPESTGLPELETSTSAEKAVDTESSPSGLEQYQQMLADGISDETEETEEDSLAASEASENNDSETGELSSAEAKLPDSSPDIEEVAVKGPEGRKQKVKIDYSDRKAIKQAFVKAAGMRKFQAERDAAIKTHRELSEEHDSLKNEFGQLEKAFEEHGAKGIVELLGGEEAWKQAVDDELSHRDYVDNLSAEEKYQLEMKKRDEQYQRQLMTERQKREEFQKQVEEREAQAELRTLESKLHPAFDRYRFAGKLGDEATENLYDEAIWGKVKERLGEYPDEVELNQAVIDKEFRTVANMFRKHINAQTEKEVKKTVDRKKTETTKRAQVAAKKGLSGSTQQRKIIESAMKGDLSNALNAFWGSRK